MWSAWGRLGTPPAATSASARSAYSWAWVIAASSVRRSVTGAHGTSPAAEMAKYSYMPAAYRSRQDPAFRGVFDHDHPPRLPIPTTGGEPRGIEEAVERRLVDGLGEELADGAGGPKALDQVHAGTVVDLAP